MPDAGGPRYVDVDPLPDGTRLDDAAGNAPDTAQLDENGELCRFGRLAASVCAPAGGPLVDAEITVETRACDGRATTVTARTDDRGAFRIPDLRAGPARVRIQSGRFTAQYEVEILAGTEVTLSPTGNSKVCLEPDAVGLAVLTGDYDRIEEVLDGLGFEYALHCGDSQAHRAGRHLLADFAALSSFEVLFVNCTTGIDLRASNPEVELLRDNLRAFVAQGGSLYVSDLAADFVEAIWPDRVDFAMQSPPVREDPDCCVCLDCAAVCDAAPRPSPFCPEPTTEPQQCVGGGGVRGAGRVGRIEARIVDDRLAALYGARALPIDFDLPGWVEIDGVSADVEVLVEGDFGDRVRPLIVAFQPERGGGRVVYTSFHNDDQATEDIRALLSALVFEL